MKLIIDIFKYFINEICLLKKGSWILKKYDIIVSLICDNLWWFFF